MAAIDAKIFLVELKGQKQGAFIGDSIVVHGPLDMKKGLQCFAYEYGVASQYDLGSGKLVGRRIHTTIRVVKEVDSASPLLWQALCTNEVITGGKLSFARPDGTGKLALHTTIEITTGAIVKYRTWHGVLPNKEGAMIGDVGAVHTNELEEFEFTFDKIIFSNTIKSKSASDQFSAQT